LNSELKKYSSSLNDTKTNLNNLNENNLIERRNQIDTQLKSSASQAERYQLNMKRQDETIYELNPKLDRLKKEYQLLKHDFSY
jgi:cell division protein FtsB